MKNAWIVSLVIGLIVMFLFPEPETNFIAYIAVVVFFVILTVVLFKKFKK